ncbi:hypothetical protein CVT24_002673 [Panaeolus cyanescens]|uniref:C2H2-type domain-containing protein n=1 Tax=Panaeolus cyanescens TaxID=181874 RepID=A0A409X1M5_9AGAR|nr:hypothetical protein CVT24_002673 [Panaeolus cyanescens]
MPRVDTKNHSGGQFYHSQFNGNSQYLPESSTSPPPLASNQTNNNSSSTTTTAKKKHVCSTCERAFTTSGHLARHSRVHTGERNHKCPFPGCETRCSRQDNLQQHYRIHLSPGSRRSSARSAASRALNNTKRASTASTAESTPSLPPLSSPPALEPARVYNHHASPPDSPPPLAQATLPATATMPLAGSRLESSSARSSASPDAYVPLSPPPLAMSNNNQGFNYRSVASNYQEQQQSQNNNFSNYSHSQVSNGNSSFSSYSSSHDSFENQSSARDQSNGSISSRHSISHISHPQSSYSQAHASSVGPPSPASSHSVSSHTSGPPTPTYPVFHDDGHYHGNGAIIDQQSHMSNGHINSQPQLVHNGYGSNVQSHGGRFDSPPPILAPIQDDRIMRRVDDRHSQSHNASPYIHHPQPLPTDYPYHQSMTLGHGAWKQESGMRKGVGATLV